MRAWFALLTRARRGRDHERCSPATRARPRRASRRRSPRFFHGADAARDARAAFDRQFRDREVPDDVPEVAFPRPWPSEGVPLAILLREVALAGAQARRAA